MAVSLQRQEIRNTGISVPRLILGTSALGNLYQELKSETKHRLIEQWFAQIEAPVCIDTAGKYGAGLALEEIGRGLAELDINFDNVVISNKLGWKRIPLNGDEPQFEPGVWKNLSHDAVQRISYDGILECWRQGNELLGGRYKAQLVSVHDPDEYLAAAKTPAERNIRTTDIKDAYRALSDLKAAGQASAVGVGAKDWKVIREIVQDIELDWVMFAGSLTVLTHPAELLQFMDELRRAGVFIINSAVFNAGFLVGGSYFDYRPITRETDPSLFEWRDRFDAVCREYGVKPADACVEFGLAPAGVSAIALNTAHPERIAGNVRSVQFHADPAFWEALYEAGLVLRTPEMMQ